MNSDARVIENIGRRVSELEKLVNNSAVRLAQPSAWTMRMVKVTGRFSASTSGGPVKPNGFYTCLKTTGTAVDAGTHAYAGTNLAMPEGMYPAPADDQDILINLAEDAGFVSPLRTSSWHLALRIGVYRKTLAGGSTVINDILACDASITTVVGKITDTYASGSAGAGRYKLAIAAGAVLGLDPTSNFTALDSALTAPSSPNAVWCNLFEAGANASGTAVVATGSLVAGICVGTDNETPTLPVLYGSSAPTGALFRVALTMVGNYNGNKTTPAAYTYNVTTLGGLQIGSALTPERPRPNGTMTAATKGTAYLTATGQVVLAEAWETPGTGACS